ncbi:FxsA family membrane protein [Streptomyces radicis]|uniref:FxsA family protein n=1 Tax=Streptomyces radicis TaxID=1750517 RepID=A0A3A9WIF6_9ACTN|nr:FxsA family membrane protein [Streptomyces radicis]RKN12610.1 FxsA family protein [Streptomyces radicis]RKN27627.1 FxsA family protein [Streptomyces radicis]
MTTGEPNPYRRRRPRRGTRALLPLVFAAWALLEIWLYLVIGDATNGWLVLLLLVAAFLLGALVIKQAGRRAWQRLAQTLNTGTPPGDDRATRGGNGLAMLGGLLLMTPGLISDALGLLCVFPPTAALIRGAGLRYLRRGAGPVGVAFEEARAARDQARMRRPGGKVVQGEVIRDDEDAHGEGRGDGGEGEPGGAPPERR